VTHRQQTAKKGRRLGSKHSSGRSFGFACRLTEENSLRPWEGNYGFAAVEILTTLAEGGFFSLVRSGISSPQESADTSVYRSSALDTRGVGAIRPDARLSIGEELGPPLLPRFCKRFQVG
jgi:hypothetical protein